MAANAVPASRLRLALAGRLQDLIVDVPAQTKARSAERVEGRTHGGDEAALLGREEHAGRPDHGKAQVFGEPPGLEIVEDHPLGPCLKRQADGLSLASIERGVRHPAVQRPLQRLRVDPGRKLRHAGCDLALDGGRNHDFLVESLKERKLADLGEGDQYAGVSYDDLSHSSMVAFSVS